MHGQAAYRTLSAPCYQFTILPLPKRLTSLWNAVEICSQHNSDAALFTFGTVAMNLHFQSLVDLKGEHL